MPCLVWQNHQPRQLTSYNKFMRATLCEFSSPPVSTAFHQQPEVIYLPRFSPQLISLERYTLSVHRTGEIDLFENLDIVHITLLVVGP